jgi:hypothetical protein
MAADYPACTASAARPGRDPVASAYFRRFLCVLPDLVAGFATGFGAGLVSAALGISPSTDLTGQILKTGHFLQPTAMAMGQMVMKFLYGGGACAKTAVCPGAGSEPGLAQEACP